MSENLYFNQIRQLIELQKVDDEIFEVKQELETAPKNLVDLQQKFDSVDARRNHVLDKLSHLKDQQKRLSIEIDGDSDKIKKSKNKMMQVGNTKEYHAMMREMDTMEKINRTREEEKMALLEELQLQNDALEEVTGEYEAIKEELDTKTANLEATLENARSQLSELEKRRAIFSDGIPKPIFQRYEFIRRRLEHPVIVPVDDGICSGCHIAIPPQSFIELQTGQQILSCSNCQRLIFWSQHFEDPETVRAAAAAKKPAAVETAEDEDLVEESSREEE